MENWFQEHPVYTIVGHTILIATTTWIISSFIIDENRVNLYKAQTENASAQINNEKAISEQYKAKISVLELELSKLRQENQRYLSWLSQEPKSIPALENKIKALEDQLKTVLAKVKSGLAVTPNQDSGVKLPYEFKSPFLKGESFVDPKTKATLGVSGIYADYTASGVIYLPGSGTVELDNVKPGSSWEFEKDGTKYKLTLNGVNWLNNRLEASVAEMKKANRPNQ